MRSSYSFYNSFADHNRNRAFDQEQSPFLLNRNFGTDDLARALEQTKLEASKTPKSISDVTNIKLPVIEKDFPEFNIGDMKARAENVAVSYLRAIDELNPAILSEGGLSLRPH